MRCHIGSISSNKHLPTSKLDLPTKYNFPVIASCPCKVYFSGTDRAKLLIKHYNFKTIPVNYDLIFILASRYE